MRLDRGLLIDMNYTTKRNMAPDKVSLVLVNAMSPLLEQGEQHAHKQACLLDQHTQSQ